MVRKTLRARALVIAAALGSATFALGDTWDNGSGSGLWSTINNWADNTEPTSTDPVIFPTPIPLGVSNISLSAGEHAASITFNDSYRLAGSGSGVTLHGTGGNIGVAGGKVATIESFITGSVGLSKTGTGTLVLGGVNDHTFTGDVNIAGVLNINENSKLGNTANQVWTSIGVTQGTLQISSNFSTSRVINVGAFGGTILVDATRTFTMQTGFGSTAGSPLNINGAGTLVLNAASSRSGGTNISNGTVRLGNGGGLGTIGGSFTNATLELNAGVTHSVFTGLKSNSTLRTIGAGAIHNGTVSVDPGVSVTLNSGDSATHTLSIADFDGGSGSTTHVTGLGTITLNGTTNNYSGAWSVESGILRLTHADSVTTSASPIVISSGATVQGEATNNYPGAWTVNGLLRAMANVGTGTAASTVNVNTAGTLQVENSSIVSSVALSGGATLKGIGNATASGVTTAAAGVPILNLATGASASDTLTISSYTGGSGSLTRVSGSGEVILPTNNTYAGGWVIDSGSLRIDSPGATGTDTSPIIVNSGGTFHIKSGSIFRNITLNNGSTLKGSLNVANNAAMPQAVVTIGSAAAVTFSNGSPGHLSIGVGAGTLTGGGGGSTITIAPSSFVSLHKASDYVGNWIINGTLEVTDDAQLGNAANTVKLGGTLQADASITTSRQIIAPGIITSYGTTTINGPVTGSGGNLTVFGPGTTILNAPGTYTGNFFTISSNGTLKINNSAALGNGLFSIGSDSTVELGPSVTLSQDWFHSGTVRGNNGASTTGTMSADNLGDPFTLATVNAGDVFTVGKVAAGISTSIIHAAGPGRVALSTSGTYVGKWSVDAGTLAITAENQLGTSGGVTVNGGTFELNTTSMSSVPLTLNSGTLRAVGLSSYTNSGSPAIANSGANVNLTVAGASDRLDIGSAIRSASAAASTSTIHVNGPGHLRLQSGGTSATDIYGGSWEQSNGILQVGQTNGSSINALGFKNGDPKQANSITVNGGTLAVGATGTGVGTPAFLRANVTLAGGSIASTNGVNAQFGGDFIVSPATTSKVLVFDPLSPATARTVILIAGAAGTDNLAATTSWGSNSTLVVDAGTTFGGGFTIARDGGTISVGPVGATLQINPGASVSLGGTVDALSNGIFHVNIVNNSAAGLDTFFGNKNIGTLSGAGNTLVSSSASLTARHVRQTNLTIGAGSKVTIRANGTSAGVSILDTLNLSGTLDLKNNDLVVNLNTYASIRGLVLAGFGTTGPGITSSTSDGSQILALFDNGFVGATDWEGQPIGANAIVGKYTYFGDANIDGQVTGDDYTVIDANLNTTPPDGLAWLSGDMNLDGDVTGDDYTVIDANLGLGVGNPLAPSMLNAVPEPTGFAFIVSAYALLKRRRRERR